MTPKQCDCVVRTISFVTRTYDMHSNPGLMLDCPSYLASMLTIQPQSHTIITFEQLLNVQHYVLGISLYLLLEY